MTARKTSRQKVKGSEIDAGYSKFRTRWRHVMLIDKLIREGNAPNCQRLSQELEVSRRTILRDIDFMKSDMGAPLDYDPQKRGYVYTESSWSMPGLQITEGELFTLMIAEKALEAYSGTPWVARLRQVFGRMAVSLPERIEVAPQELLMRVSFDTAGSAEVDPAVLEAIAKAVAKNLTVEFTYSPLWTDKARTYKVDPYVLRRMQGAWYLAGRDHRSGHIPLFNLSRMNKAHVTQRSFDYVSSGFDPKAYFAGTFSAYHTSECHHVTIEFTGFAAKVVRERHWHDSQRLKDLPDGRLRMDLDISHLNDICPWVLSWGSEAKAVAPAELARQVADQLIRASQMYMPNSSTENP
jgi:predicted DNA-binding transcriptional regulator YafY